MGSGVRIFGYTPAQLAKGILSTIATLVTILTAALAIPGIIPLTALPYITGAVSVLGTIAVTLKGNAPVVGDARVAGRQGLR